MRLPLRLRSAACRSALPSSDLFSGRSPVANKNLFGSLFGRLTRADVRNEAGGPAYRLAPKHALAQLAATGCFNGSYYADAEDQLDTLLALAGQVDDAAFLAKLAVYSRERAYLKDMPAALLLVVL